MSFEIQRPPKLLMLPEDRSPEARICTLAHPRTSTPCRYYFDPAKGIYEFTRVAAPKSVCRSWLITGAKRTPIEKNNLSTSVPGEVHIFEALKPPNTDSVRMQPIADGYIIKNAQMLVATPIDSLFLLLPSLCAQSSAKPTPYQRLFLSADDILEKLSERSKHFDQILNHDRLRLELEERMRAVCDTVDAGGEMMYRINEEKLLNEMVLKAKSMAIKGLPASLEGRFIRKTLEIPVRVLRREESSLSNAAPTQVDTPTSETAVSDTVDSQASTAASESAVSAISHSTGITVPSETDSETLPCELLCLFRLRTALTYMFSSYVPKTLATLMEDILASGKSAIDFEPLDTHLAHVATLRAEALASRSFGDFSRKRNTFEEDEVTEHRAEKKTRLDEEERKKKAGETRGMRDLKKANTRGMKKMSDFFGKSTTAKKQ